MRKNCKTFEEWCISQYEEYMAVYHKSKSLTHYLSKNLTRATIIHVETGKTATASTKIGDARIAIALAWAEYKGEEIPVFRVKLIDLVRRGIFKFKLGAYTYTIMGENPNLPYQYVVVDNMGQAFTFRSTKEVFPL